MRRQPLLPLLIQQPVEDGAHRALLLAALEYEFPQPVVEQVHLVMDFFRPLSPHPEDALWDVLQEWKDINRWSGAEGVNVSPDFQEVLNSLHIRCVDCCGADSIYYKLVSVQRRFTNSVWMVARTYAQNNTITKPAQMPLPLPRIIEHIIQHLHTLRMLQLSPLVITHRLGQILVDQFSHLLPHRCRVHPEHVVAFGDELLADHIDRAVTTDGASFVEDLLNQTPISQND